MAGKMNRLFVVALVVALGTGCGKQSKLGSPSATDRHGQKAEANPDEELLQGTWAMISFEKDGRKEKDVAKGPGHHKGCGTVPGGRRARSVTPTPFPVCSPQEGPERD